MSKLDFERGTNNTSSYNGNGEMKFTCIAEELDTTTGVVRYAYKNAIEKLRKSCDEKLFTYLMLSLEGE